MMKKPCNECPFNKKNVLPKHKRLGGSDPIVYIGQIEGPFWLPCHMDRNYEGKETNPEEVKQCAGAAIYRANLGISERFPKDLLKLDSGDPDVYTSHVEFLSDHLNVSLEFAENLLKVITPIDAVMNEIRKSEVKLVKKTKL